MTPGKKTETMSFVDFSKSLHLPIYVTRNMILNDDPKIPYLGKYGFIHIPNKKDVNTWYLDLTVAKKLNRIITNLPKKWKDSIADVVSKLVDPRPDLIDIVANRKAICEENRRFVFTKYVAWFEQTGVIFKNDIIDKGSWLLTSIFTYEDGKKITDHAWVSVIEQNCVGYKLPEPKQFITFYAKGVIYKSSGNINMGLGYLKKIKPISMEDLKIWKADIKKRRNI